jgi:hypothetical protein
VAEIIELKEVVQARARRRTQALTARCLVLMEEALAGAHCAYGDATLPERVVWVHKIRQLEDLIAYTTCIAGPA